MPWAHGKICVSGSLSQGFRIPGKHLFGHAKTPVSKAPVYETPGWGRGFRFHEGMGPNRDKSQYQ